MLMPLIHNDLLTPYDDINHSLFDVDTITQQEDYTFLIDGTGKLQVVNTGGTSASEGGMGSGSQDNKEKGQLQHPVTGEDGGTPNEDSEAGWDPIGENIKEETAKKQQESE